MAYFKVDAAPDPRARRRASTSRWSAADDEESVVGSRPNLVASFPPHVAAAARRRRPDRGRHSKALHFFDEAWVRRFASCAIAARSPRLRWSRWRQVGATSPPPVARALAAAGAELARVAAHLLRDAGPLRERRRRRTTRAGSPGRACKTGFDPTDPAYYHGGDLKAAGLHRRTCSAIKDLGFTALWVTPVAQAGSGRERQRRLPRLLGPRLHDGRPAPRHRPGLRRARRQRARPRAEGVPRRRRQPHGGHRPADGHVVHRRARTAPATARSSTRRAT